MSSSVVQARVPREVALARQPGASRAINSNRVAGGMAASQMISIGRCPESIVGMKNEADVARGQLTMAVLEYRSALMRYLMARSVPPDEAEDIIQDIFVKVQFQPACAVADPRAYIYRMAENLLLDRHRAAWRRGRRELAWTELQSGPVMEADDRPSPERTLIARERLESVAEALRALPGRTVAIFRRFRIDGDLQREIAAEMGISTSAVEKHLRRAYRVVAEVRARLDLDAQSPSRLNSFRNADGEYAESAP